MVSFARVLFMLVLLLAEYWLNRNTLGRSAVALQIPATTREHGVELVPIAVTETLTIVTVTTLELNPSFSTNLTQATPTTINPTTTFSAAATLRLNAPPPSNLPSDLPYRVYPEDQLSSSTDLTGYTLVNFFFNLALNWKFMIGNGQTSSQILEYMPLLLEMALQINSSQILPFALQVNIPSQYTGPSDAAALETMYLVYIPSDYVSALQDQVRDSQSRFYTGVNSTMAHLAAYINPGENILSFQTPTTTSRKKSLLGPLIGSVIGSVALISMLGVLLYLRHRRRKHHMQLEQQMPQAYDLKLVIDTDSNVDPDQLGYLNNTSPPDLNAITSFNLKPAWPTDSSANTFEVVDLPLQQQQRHSQSSHRTATPTLTDRQNHIVVEAQNARDILHILEQTQSESESEGRIALIQERMAEMMSRLMQLEEERNSDWARGLTNEPPPSYFGASAVSPERA